MKKTLILLWLSSACCFLKAQDIVGPAGADTHNFGESVTILTNGNIVVTDPLFDLPGIPNVGAVYLYKASDLSLISTLTGSKSYDRVGSDGVTALSNGNYVINSSDWNNDRGAVTWGNGTTGITGVVSSANSLVGSRVGDGVGNGRVTALSNGNYVVRSPNWNNGGLTEAGAVTWCNGTTGITDTVSATNSLVGSSANDRVGSDDVTALSNGNYVVRSIYWNNNRGAVTWGNGTTGITGVVSAANSLVGSTAGDQERSGRVTALSNGNYVVSSPYWDNGVIPDAGAVTWGNGTIGITGVISAANSLVGSSGYDYVGNGGVIALSNGNYVVRSTGWDNGGIIDAGAVTWGNGTTGITGVVSAANSLVGPTAYAKVGSVIALSNGNYVVLFSGWNNSRGAVTWGNGTTGITGTISAANSLVGSTTNDKVGSNGVTALSNGNYVVISINWDNGGIIDAGAVTWCNGTTGITDTVSAANSLVGSKVGDYVGNYGVTALSNGNYVVRSIYWNNNRGAVTWCNGTTGITGVVSATNSLVGSTADDRVGIGGVTALSNGNYVVSSPIWDNGAIKNVGAVTWGNGTTGIMGTISDTNSLMGSTAYDGVGSGRVTALSNGNYVISSPYWNNRAITSAGAVTWGNGTTGITGTISDDNSLEGSSAGDQVGSDGVTALSNGNYVVRSRYWDNGAITDAGAVTWGNGTTGSTGTVSAANSLVGSTTNDQVGYGGVTALSNGNYVVSSSRWDNGAITDAGAATWGDGTSTLSGNITATNSVLGTVSSGISFVIPDNVNNRFAISRVNSNIVTMYPTIASIPIETLELSSQAVSIYPNPSNGLFYLDLKGLSENIDISVTNVLGTTVFKEVINNPNAQVYTIDLKNKAKGLYILNLKTQNNLISKKLVLE